MNLKWSPEFGRFEAEFHDFQADHAVAKAAGFKCDGPPSWVWSTSKALVLKQLRENKPPTVSLTITPEARAQYERLLPNEEKNAEVRAALAVAKKAVKKQQAKVEREAEKHVLVVPEKGYIGAEDLPPMPPCKMGFVPPPPPETKCMVCRSPIYDYEYASEGPFMCLWCAKNLLDKSENLC